MTGGRGGRWRPRYDLYPTPTDDWGGETPATAEATAATAAAAAPRAGTTSAGTTSNHRRRGQENDCAPQRCRPSGRPLAARPDASCRQTSTPPPAPPPHGTLRWMMPAEAGDGHPLAETERSTTGTPSRKRRRAARWSPCARPHGWIYASTAPANTSPSRTATPTARAGEETVGSTT